MNILNSNNTSIKTFLGLSSFQLLAMFRRGLFYTYLSIYLRNFLNLSVTETTLYATLPMIMNVFFQNIIWGPLSDKTQKRRTLVISGEILAGIGTIIVWLIHASISNLMIAGYTIIFGLTCIEAFWSMSNIGWSALISDIYILTDRSKVMGRLNSIGGFGRIIGISIGGFLYDNGFGFRNGPLFIIASFVMLVSTLSMLLSPEGGINPEISLENELEKNVSENINRGYKSIFIIFVISLIFINFGRNSISVPYSQYLSLSSGFNVDSILLSFITNMRSLAVMTIGLIAGFLSKKIGDSKALILGSSLAVFSLLITALTDQLSFIFLGSFLLGTAEVIIYAASYTIASKLIPKKSRAKLFGAYNASFFLSWGLASTLISGPLIDFLLYYEFNESFAYQMSFLVGSFLVLLGLFIFLILAIKHKQEIVE